MSIYDFVVLRPIASSIDLDPVNVLGVRVVTVRDGYSQVSAWLEIFEALFRRDQAIVYRQVFPNMFSQ